MSSNDKRCVACQGLTRGEWCGSIGDGARITLPLCGDCFQELADETIDDFGDEFPEESHDDVDLPDLD